MADYRDDVGGDPEEIAAIAHELYESDDFEETIADFVDEVLAERLVDAGIDESDRRWIAERMARESKSALFLIRNGLLSCAEADLQHGDIIRMVAANDPDKTIEYGVRTAYEDSTAVAALRVAELVDGERESIRPEAQRVSDFGAGQIIYDERFSVDRGDRESDASVDDHDRLVGVDGIGDATAETLLDAFTIEEICELCQDVPAGYSPAQLSKLDGFGPTKARTVAVAIDESGLCEEVLDG